MLMTSEFCRYDATLLEDMTGSRSVLSPCFTLAAERLTVCYLYQYLRMYVAEHISIVLTWGKSCTIVD